MEKERFLELARNYTALTEAETRDLDELQKLYPYSQIIHNLASRGANDHQLESSTKLLNISAVYSSDRGVLKSIITAPRTERVASVETTFVETVPQVVKTEPNPGPLPEVSSSVEDTVHHDGLPDLIVDSTPSPLSGQALNDEIMSDLNRLKELKHHFEATVEEFEHSKGSGSATKTKTKAAEAKKTAKSGDGLAPEPSSEGLLEEIKSKRKFTPESQKQKDQIDIIDQFIKKQPSIPKGGGPSADSADLAEKNLSLTDSTVSETLVEILLKQGKKDKAIEVLKKLIWKFPQKKAIFAAQIEELKK